MAIVNGRQFCCDICQSYERKDHLSMNTIKAIIGLGNPGATYQHNRHNIGFQVADALVNEFAGAWQQKENMMIAELKLHDQKVLVIKPQTYMNNSGRVCNYLQKQGIKAENIVVVHDELEKPFGSVTIKQGGSHKGHNGLKSIISVAGLEFWRLRFGIGRPEVKELVPHYVLENFKEPREHIDALVAQSVSMIVDLVCGK